MAFEFSIMKESFFPEFIDPSKLSSCQCIIIDGDDHSGKSPLAHKIANALGAKVISLDEYLPGDGRPYCDQIDYESLQNDISSSAQKVVIEGVCMLKVLAKINVHYDYHIFTKRIMFGKSAYEEYLDERTPLPKSKMARDIVQYYREFKPFDKCQEIQNLCIDKD
jgi:uridine kinase